MGFFTGGTSGGFFGAPQGQRSGLEREFERVTQLSQAAQVPLPPAPIGALERTLDILGRPIFTVAGFADSLLNEGGNVGDALKRAGTEAFSGIGGLEGQKETFGRVLADAGVPEGIHASEIAPYLFTKTGDGWKFKRGGAMDFSARDAGGFALDVAGDPLSYLSFGTTRGATQLLKNPAVRKQLAGTLGKEGLRRAAATGKIPLTKKGLGVLRESLEQNLPEATERALKKHLTDLGEETIPELAGTGITDVAQALERTGKWGPEKVLREAVDIHVHADQLAAENALKQVLRFADMGQAGLIDSGGIKFAGKTIIAGEKFAPIGDRATKVIQRAAETRMGAQFARFGRGVDAIFKETRAAARRVPGFEAAKTVFRSDRAAKRADVKKTVSKIIPKGWRKETVRVGAREIPLHEYVIRHLDAPGAYPIQRMPPSVAAAMPELRHFFNQMAKDEVGAGILDANTVRAHLVPHMYRNSKEELKRVAQAVQGRGRTLSGEGVTAWRELQVFDSLDQAQAAAKEIGIELKPILDLEDLMLRRGDGHATSMALHEFQRRMTRDFGLSEEIMARQLTEQTFPELAGTLNQAVGRLEPFVKDDFNVRLGKALAGGTTKDLTPAEKGLFLIAKMRDATDIKDVEKILIQHADMLDGAAPGLRQDMMQRIGLERMNYLNSFNEPMELVTKGPMKGTALPSALADDVSRMGKELFRDREMSNMLKGYDALMNHFRMGVTAFFVPFHLRNAYSNVALNFVDMGISAFDPVRAGRVARLLAGGDGTLRTRRGAQYTFSELRAMAKRFNVIPEQGSIQELTQEGLRRDTVLGRMKDATRVPQELVENPARLMNWMTHLERGLDPAAAAMRTNQVLIDYGSISQTERQVFRRLFSFPKWMIENVQNQARALTREPGRLVTTVKPGISGLVGGPDRDVLPEYLAGEFNVKVSDTKDGKVFLTGIDLPFTGAIEQVFGTPSKNFLAQNVNALSPYLTLAVELASGRDLFTGKNLDEARTVGQMGELIRRMPEPTKKFLQFEESIDPDSGQRKYTANGTRLHIILKGFAVSRFVATGEQLAGLTDEDVDINAAVMDALIGVEPREYDLTEAQTRRVRSRLKRMERELVRRGKVKTFTRTFAPQGTETRTRLEQLREEESAGGFFGGS